MADQHNIFIPHRHEDDQLVGELKNLLRRHGAEVRDSSITSKTPNNAKAPGYIKDLLADHIRWAGKIIVIISPDTKNHPWVDWEVEYANRFGDKRIIGVWAPGTEPGDMPAALEDYADAIVNWDGPAILDAIDGADNWTDPDGGRAPEMVIARARC
ncbi:hypothetical protein GCM10025783_05750 [Amnibacterium soli]|uniref:Thoeris protein ThsB TIR-like domain-containing protein n=1 Tax=Amnibacterium soli TaxID=1282736 RepID=A0ABP8YTD8_9MICO